MSKGRTITIAILAMGLSFAASGPTAAGPDCSRKPDHPSCAGGGGDDGGGSDDGSGGCSLNTTNPPAFLYTQEKKVKGKSYREIMLSDASGQCTVSTGQLTGFGANAFHYIPGGGAGALAFTPDLDGDNLYEVKLLRFAVDGNGVVFQEPFVVTTFDSNTEYVSDLDLAGSSAGSERLFVTWVSASGTSRLRGLSELDLSPCTAGTVTDCFQFVPGSGLPGAIQALTTNEQNDCLNTEVAAGRDPFLAAKCYQPYGGGGGMRSANEGTVVYAGAATNSGYAETRFALLRFEKDAQGWGPPELVFVHSDFGPYLGGVHPVSGTIVVRHTHPTNYIAFVDPNSCMPYTDTGVHWMTCLDPNYVSDARTGDPVWIESSSGVYEVLYSQNHDRGAIRIADFSIPAVTNDRELLRGAMEADSGL